MKAPLRAITTTTTGRLLSLATRPPLPLSPSLSLTHRLYSTSNLSQQIIKSSSQEVLAPSPPPRWLSDLRSRVGKCIIFGCSPEQTSRAAGVLSTLATEWRQLLAGSEGFLTGGRRGLDSQRVAWGEMDSFGHVNNVTYYRYAESARVNWITNFAVHVDPANGKEWADLMAPRGTGLIMRSLKCDFKFPMVYPDKISVYHKLRVKPGGDPAPSNFMLDCMVLSHQHRRVAAKLEEDIVVYDYETAKKTSMPRFMQDMFLQTHELQEREMVRARTKIWDLLNEVEALEKETWDREDAKEDFGSSSAKKQ
ncbi:thioesterase-like superfamily-domain-containing protein [Diplogelasinospora grovesii]|uniref:Thioesterase-like superfamily-domain-containing protein n=1 Tax=Diplogelasinospora grovesii TaxID=303347 RepID=A0AAN6S0V0_9PEZI|nr:thioesterase-like superfamily-domain-containing protein [Diplogelasinospora grovesii]